MTDTREGGAASSNGKAVTGILPGLLGSQATGHTESQGPEQGAPLPEAGQEGKLCSTQSHKAALGASTMRTFKVLGWGGHLWWGGGSLYLQGPWGQGVPALCRGWGCTPVPQR